MTKYGQTLGIPLDQIKEWLITIWLLRAIATKQRASGLNSLVLIFPSLSMTSQLMK